MAWIFLLSFAPAVLLSLRHVPWIVWVVPVVLAYAFRRQWEGEGESDRRAMLERQEEPPDFCFAFETGSSTRERWKSAILRWRMAVDALPDGVLMLDYRFALCWFNPEARHLLGLFDQRDLGKPLAYRLGQPVLDDYLQRGDFSQPLDLPSPVDGGRMLNLRFVLLEQEHFWLVLVLDITDRYQMDRQHRDFMDNISHELKTPITVFRGVLELLPDLPQDSPQWENALGLLRKQTQRMQNLIEDQTALLRLGPARHGFPVEAVAMEPFLQEMIEAAESLSGARKHVFLLSCEDGFAFHVNRELLRCVVANLLFNAVNHTPDQTEVRVEWKQDDRRRPTLTVGDNGPGIASYHLPRLTEKYYRVTFQSGNSRKHHPEYQGTGLGLSLVKEAMERAQGKLEIVSQAGIGSRFICRFPAVAEV
ncbi:MAG: PAS domain-containing sensor histidine kinase [Magnetococcales bacterium]|nr:PAS domain-containing sensor histidine kinase [Magnetococcales bacterium]